MKKLALLILLLPLTLSALAQAKPASDDKSAMAGIVVTPARIAFQLERNTVGKKSITIKNLTQKKQQMAVELMDWYRDTVGEHQYFPAGTLPYSCAKWLTIDKPLMVLEPGQSTDLVVTMAVPDSAAATSQMKWAMVVIKSLQDKRIPRANTGIYDAQVDKTLGIGVHIYEIPSSITTKELKMVSFAPKAGEKNVYRVVCKNVGGLQLYGKFTVELTSSTGQKTAIDAQTVPMFPGQTRYVDFILPATLPKGKYTAIALIDANDDEVPIEAAQKEITIQ
jgi:hypothetical protein